MAMARIVLIAVIASAPASLAALAILITSALPMPTLIMSGLLVLALIVLTILLTISGSSPTSIPIFATCGQDRLIS
jgi:hypothetical protein